MSGAQTSTFFTLQDQPLLKTRALVWFAIAAIHAAALAWLWYVPEPATTAHLERTMMVSLVPDEAPVVIEHPKPAVPVPPTPPKPRPRMIATPNPASAAAITVPPEDPIEEPIQQVLSPPPMPAAAPAPVATSSEDSVIPPDYRAAYLSNPGPQYPTSSRRRREEGVVMLKVLVSASGAPDQVLVDQSSSFPDLDNAAASIVKDRWRFVPAKQRNVPVQAWVVVPVSFVLKNR